MFDSSYNDWNHKRVKAIIDHYGYQWFKGKKVLDLGAGHGEIGAALVRLGADVTCIDAREENLAIIRKNHPYLKTVKIDLDNAWPYAGQVFDIVLSLGLICHLKNYDRHIREICGVAENIIIETAVLDSSDSDLKIAIYEEKSIDDLSFHGEGIIVSANDIQNKLSELGAIFKRVDDFKINSGQYRYDWKENDSQARTIGNRRLWFARIDKHFAKILANQQHSAKIVFEATAAKPTIPMATPAPTFRNPKTSYLYKAPIHRGPPPRSYIPINPPSQKLTINVQEGFPKIRLFFNYYEDPNPERKKEIDFCLQKNRDNPLFDDVIILSSDTNPTFNFFFEHINRLTGPDDINIICNSDIFFDNTIVLAANVGSKDFYALSRWDWKSDNDIKLREVRNSQDAWIVRGAVTGVDGSFPLGKPFCDNRIAYEFNRSGYSVTNPSRSIKAYHVHNSGVRHYGNRERIDGPSLFVDITSLPSIPVFALTSMSPKQEQFKIQKEAVLSWMKAGCKVVAFQSANDLKSFNPDEWRGVCFVETESSKRFPNYIPISSMTEWVSKQIGYALLINADCHLSATTGVMQKIANFAEDGMVYIVRQDVDANGQEKRKLWGIDAFMFPTKYAKLIPSSDILCMGKPWWDYTVPLSILRAGKKISSPAFPMLFHATHAERWGADYDYCKSEAFRLFDWKTNAVDMYNEIVKYTVHFSKDSIYTKLK